MTLTVRQAGSCECQFKGNRFDQTCNQTARDEHLQKQMRYYISDHGRLVDKLSEKTFRTPLLNYKLQVL